MYAGDHLPPHFHVLMNDGREALVEISTLAVMRGSVPARELTDALTWEPVGLGNRRLQIGRSGPFFTVFLPHSLAMGLQIRQKLSSLGPIFAFDAPSPTGSWAAANGVYLSQQWKVLNP